MLKEILTASIIATTPIMAQSIEQSDSIKTKQTEESGISFGVEMGSSTKYVTGGMEFNKNPTVESGIDVSISGFTAGICNNYSPADKLTNELDFNMEYEKIIGKFDMVAGASYIRYPSDPESPEGIELYGRLGYEFIKMKESVLTPEIRITKDIINKGVYGTIFLKTSSKLSDGWNVDFNIGGAYNHNYWREGKGMSHMEIQLSLEALIWENLIGTISATYIGDLTKLDINKEDSYVLGNINLRYEF